MTRRLGSGEPRFDRDRTLYVLRDNIAQADAMITAAERLIEDSPGGIRDDDGDEDESDCGDSLSRRRNHLAHLIESAKRAVRAAVDAGNELDRHRGAS
jgi:hypothetical protein